MSRLTKKIKNPKYSNDYEMLCAHNYHILNKLGKLEDLEDQLGCPLEVVFKALQIGIYYGDNADWMSWSAVDLYQNLEVEYVLYSFDEKNLLTKDYKKTWWLKEDRSE